MTDSSRRPPHPTFRSGLRLANRSNSEAVGTWLLAWVLLAILFVSGSSAHAQVQRNRARPPQDGQEAQQVDGDSQSVVLQIDGGDRNSGEQRMDAQTLVGLLQSTALTDPVLASALTGEPTAARTFVTINAQPTNNRFVSLSVVVRRDAPGFAPGVAHAIVKGVCDRLRIAIEQSSKASNAVSEARRTALETELNAAKQRLADASTAFAEARDANGGNAMNNGGADNARYQRQNLEQQKQQIELQLVGSRARLKAIAEIAAAAATQPSEPAAVPNDSPWATVIQLREKKLELVRRKLQSGVASADEVADAEAALAEARAYASMMAPADFNSARRRYSDGAEYTRNETSSLRVTIAENQARLAILDEQLAKLPPVTSGGGGRTFNENINFLQSDEQQARNEVANLQSQMSNEGRRGNRSTSPIVLTVLDGAAAK